MLQAAKRAILLSGTPALNKPCELYQQLNSIVRETVQSHKKLLESVLSYPTSPATMSLLNVIAFDARIYGVTKWSISVCPPATKSRHLSILTSAYRLVDELNLLLTETIMIRRLKKDVQKELPSKLRSKIPMEIAPSVLREIEDLMNQLNRSQGGNRENWINDRNKLSDGSSEKVRHEFCYTKYYLFQSRPMLGQLFKLTGEAKIEAVSEYLDYLLEIEKCFLVFAHHMVVLDALEEKMKTRKVSSYYTLG